MFGMEGLAVSAEIAYAEARRSGKPVQKVPEGAMRVGPGSDAVVWNICDSSHVECEL